MYIIRKEFHLSASHILEGLRENHPCGRMHGHNYKITVELRDDNVDSTGFVVDYGDLVPVKRFIDLKMDHRHLNDVFPGMQPSAENLAQILFITFLDLFPQLYAVEVDETPKTKARYERS